MQKGRKCVWKDSDLQLDGGAGKISRTHSRESEIF